MYSSSFKRVTTFTSVFNTKCTHRIRKREEGKIKKLQLLNYHWPFMTVGFDQKVTRGIASYLGNIRI